MSSTRVDYSRVARTYAQGRPDYPQELIRRLSQLGVGHAGQRLLDLGTGTGAMAREMSRASCLVTGIDDSAEMLDEAIREDRDEGGDAEYVRCPAEALRLPDRRFDAAIAARSWMWFDGRRAGREAYRVLKPGGRLAIIGFEWLPYAGGLAEATEELILQLNPTWPGAGGNGLHPEWIDDVTLAGFADASSFSFDVPVTFTHAQWRHRVRSSAGIGGTLDPAQVRRFDEQLLDVLGSYFQREPMVVEHRVFGVVTVKP